MMDYFSLSEATDQNIDVQGILNDQMLRRMFNDRGNPDLDEWDGWIYLGENELEGRTESMFFRNQEVLDNWLDQQ
jgi:hypothetical protein